MVDGVRSTEHAVRRYSGSVVVTVAVTLAVTLAISVVTVVIVRLARMNNVRLVRSQ